ncbi:hypothetical protein [Desmospora profundinema]|uniref:Uncharacterized protein n=1 Tax=Desmospora profundinema TaxID=1571184 RepID=A0ABU1IIB2_9BACL|nr:hypothetical protein [Desmospora profundinema]MDR6224507.1 hypothetical protein [Desmospora profundinema]
MGTVGAIARRLFASIFVSVLLAALLSLLPLMEQKGAGEEVPAFGSPGERRLAADNMVDFLLGEGGSWDWERADWNEGRLELAAIWRGSDPDGVYKDLFRLTQSALVHTSNVQELQVSVVIRNSPRILVLRASRQQLGNDSRMENRAGFSPREYLERRFHLAVADRDS